MKSILTLAILVGSLVGSNAATVTVSAGFSNSLTVTNSGIPATNFFLALGAWDGSNFTQFGAGILDSATINGSFTAVSPTGVNSQIMHIYIGSGTTLDFAANTGWAILKSGQNTTFPSDVTSTLATATLQANNANPNTMVRVAGNLATSTLTGNVVNLTSVPEPSSVVFGIVGLLGLLRRRRN